jgi:ribosome-associated translation inhibitor RaiA
MQVQVNTDNHVRGSDDLTKRVTDSVEAALGRFREHLTRVEVHLGDENGRKGGQGDKRCAMEARPSGRQPVAVIHHADTLDEAIDGAAEQLARLLDSTFGRLHDHKGRTSFAGEQGY